MSNPAERQRLVRPTALAAMRPRLPCAGLLSCSASSFVRMAEDTRDWLPVSDDVARLLGRLLYYASWLDDVLGEAVVHGNPKATHLAESTPGWASSGKALVAAVRGIQVEHSLVDDIADRLDSLNAVRNQLVHGVWLWEKDTVMVMKRSLDPGERAIAYAQYTYAEIEAIIAQYQGLGKVADGLVSLLMKSNPASQLMSLNGPHCPIDSALLEGAQKDGLIVHRCPQCGYEGDSSPEANVRTA
jgi:hypothetical protein